MVEEHDEEDRLLGPRIENPGEVWFRLLDLETEDSQGLPGPALALDGDAVIVDVGGVGLRHPIGVDDALALLCELAGSTDPRCSP